MSEDNKLAKTSEKPVENVTIYQALPSGIRKKIRALKKLQLSTLKNEVNFYDELHKLEYDYQEHTYKLFKKRAKIIKGKVEPTDKECSFRDPRAESPDDADPVIQAEREKFMLMRRWKSVEKGIPGFWLSVLKSSDLTSGLVTKSDEPVLEYLVDIAVVVGEAHGFSLYFEFVKNPYFKNKVLCKEFVMECRLGAGRSMWDFEGPEVRVTRGCQIEWYEGMDVTRSANERKALTWVEGKGKVIHPETDTLKTDSFFNFFDTLPEDEEGLKNQLEYVRNMELMLGLYFKEELVPKAVLYYTGDVLH